MNKSGMQQEFTTKDTMGGRRSQNPEFRSQKDEEGLGDGVKGEVLLGNQLISGEMEFSPRSVTLSTSASSM